MSIVPLKLIEKDGTIRVEIHAKPRAKKSKILGSRDDGALEIAIAAPPVDGAANEELVRLLSKALGVPKRNVQIVRGDTSHKKLIAITGLSLEAVHTTLSVSDNT